MQDQTYNLSLDTMFVKIKSSSCLDMDPTVFIKQNTIQSKLRSNGPSLQSLSNTYENSYFWTKLWSSKHIFWFPKGVFLFIILFKRNASLRRFFTLHNVLPHLYDAWPTNSYSNKLKKQQIFLTYLQWCHY